MGGAGCEIMKHVKCVVTFGLSLDYLNCSFHSQSDLETDFTPPEVAMTTYYCTR